jgi:hypothetical protein
MLSISLASESGSRGIRIRLAPSAGLLFRTSSRKRPRKIMASSRRLTIFRISTIMSYIPIPAIRTARLKINKGCIKGSNNIKESRKGNKIYRK